MATFNRDYIRSDSSSASRLTYTSNTFDEWNLDQMFEKMAIMCKTEQQKIQLNTLMRKVSETGIVELTLAQQRIVPAIIQSDSVVASGVSGEGKTFAMVFSMMYHLIDTRAHELPIPSKSTSYPIGIIITNTGELASQVSNEFKRLNIGYHTVLCTKNAYVSERANIDALLGRSGLRSRFDNPMTTQNEPAEILIGTIGRLHKFICGDNPIVNLRNLKVFMVDEADAILMSRNKPRHGRHGGERNDSCYDQLCDIVIQTQKITSDIKYAFVSATWNDTIIDEISKMIKYVRMDDEAPLTLTFGEQSRSNIKQYKVHLGKKNRDNDRSIRTEVLFDLIEQISCISQCIIFVNTISDIDRIYVDFKAAFPSANENIQILHSGLSMEESNMIIRELREHRLRYVIASNMIARGIDITGINCVINFNMPKVIGDTEINFAEAAATYQHRNGRSGRGATDGFSISLITDEDEELLNYIQKANGNVIMDLPDNLSNLL